ncbi:tetratricopeptide repeat protein [Urechidicola vernalis]|uniref:Tetratricopeptide repeat protein n=1 Tax=Urechidicola vernalis TaxID=3075600 RepID=A0ABU2Y3D5_9FLAO|nr:hypothetical protein [Urechidicola sp. P050]MDT0552300.1 hypothetical protein [Urechidicola sp. P050]
MKKSIIAFALLISATAMAQNVTGVALEEAKMKQALKFGDKDVAKGALYNIITMQGETSTYKDTLAYLYFNKRNFLSCFLVTNDILERSPNNLEILEMNAISLESIGAMEKALEGYEKLLATSNRAFHAYKIAGLQFGMNKFDDANTSIKKAAQLPEEPNVKVSFAVNANYTQDVNLRAAIAYLEGLIAVTQEKKTEAIVAFERAEQFFPGFVLAKSQLDKLNEQ